MLNECLCPRRPTPRSACRPSCMWSRRGCARRGCSSFPRNRALRLVNMAVFPNRIRSIFMDCPDCDFPQRGDRIRTSGGTLYWVAMSRRIKRRIANTCPRVSLGVITSDDIDPLLKGRLLASALRRGSSRLFPLFWYPRKRKAVDFESYMRRA